MVSSREPERMKAITLATRRSAPFCAATLSKPLTKRPAAGEHGFMGLSQPMDFGLAGPAPPPTDLVKADQIGKWALDQAEGITSRTPLSHHHGAFADARTDARLPGRRTPRNRRSSRGHPGRRCWQRSHRSRLAIMADVEPTMSQQRSPTSVTPRSSSVPVFTVTPSRISQSEPITSRVGPPRYLTDCGGVPSGAKG